MRIKIQCPAKINLILKVLNKREDSFHEIFSIMQAVSLWDYLTISVENYENNANNIIELSGNSGLIPYDKDNLVYKAAELFLNRTNITGKKININIEKNIPVAAGLAGGSSDAAGTLAGLNKLFNDILDNSELHEPASQLGSDINFCLEGGTQLASSRGEVLSKISTPDLNIAVIKPKNLFISAREAYEKWDNLFISEKISDLEITEIKKEFNEINSEKTAKILFNSLEDAVIADYPEIQEIKNYLIKKGCKNAIMSGSGPSVFGIYEDKIDFSDAKSDWECFIVKTVNSGVIPIQQKH